MNIQSPPAPPPTPPNLGKGYEFLTEQPVKKNSLLGGSKKSRIAIAVAGAILLIIIGLVVYTLLNSASDGTKKDLVIAVQQQNELIRISEIGVKEATSGEARNLAVTTNLSLVSSQTELQDLAKKAGAKLDAKQLKAASNSQSDKTLEQAKQINRFDEEFTKIIESQLLAYQQTLKRIYQSAQNQNSKNSLNQLYENASILIGEE